LGGENGGDGLGQGTLELGALELGALELGAFFGVRTVGNAGLGHGVRERGEMAGYSIC